VWAKGEPPDLGSGHRVSSILTTPIFFMRHYVARSFQMDLKIEFHEFIPERLEEKTLYVSEKYETAIHLCICGCKNEVTTPFGRNGWQYHRESDIVTLSPSIGSFQLPCKSHYFIQRNKVVL
jgi:hypothetical protein